MMPQSSIPPTFRKEDFLNLLPATKQRVLKHLGLELAKSMRNEPLHGKAYARPRDTILGEITDQLQDLLPHGPYTDGSKSSELNYNANVILAAPTFMKFLENLRDDAVGAGNEEAADKHQREIDQLRKAHEVFNIVIDDGNAEYKKRRQEGFHLGL